MTNHSNALVIGIGSPFGADQFGWKMIDHLKTQQYFSGNNIRLEVCDRPGTLLLDHLNDTDMAILVDAVEGGTLGNIQIVAKEQLLKQGNMHSSHQLGIAETIALGEKLQLLPERLYIVGIETGNNVNQKILPQKLIEKVKDTIADIVDNWEKRTAKLII